MSCVSRLKKLHLWFFSITHICRSEISRAAPISLSHQELKWVLWTHEEGQEERGDCSCQRQRELLTKFVLTFSQNKEAHRQVDKDPGEAQKLHEVVHEQVPFLQACKSWKERRAVSYPAQSQREALDSNPFFHLGGSKLPHSYLAHVFLAWAPSPIKKIRWTLPANLCVHLPPFIDLASSGEKYHPWQQM